MQEKIMQEQVKLHPLTFKHPLRTKSWCKMGKEFYIDHLAITSFPGTIVTPLTITSREFSTKKIQVLDRKLHLKGLIPKISLHSKITNLHTKISLPEIKKIKKYRTMSLTTPDLKISKLSGKTSKFTSTFSRQKKKKDEGTFASIEDIKYKCE
ncbi:unnamed protein product [Blepharisma stoltei]|uniref:Uncharacterized protein n=1 Tax=Blepharisma stoltei TaxID=1481888 RepID=A0AAU9K5U8_9CILI|nr:unnamed protein product [Blepharisma stoltei]